MRTRLNRLITSHQSHISIPKQPYDQSIHVHISDLASKLSQPHPQRTFATSPPLLLSRAVNRIQPSVRRPADFHTQLQSYASTNTLFLTLFKTSTCHSCAQITPLLESIIQRRAQPSPGDKYSSIAFAELELDSPERDEGGGTGWVTMYDVGIEYGVRSVPTLIGFGGRRAERVTDRLADEKKLKDRGFMEGWIDEVMKAGDPHPSQGGIFSKLSSLIK